MIDLQHNPNDPTGPRRSRFWALRNSGRTRPIADATTMTKPNAPTSSPTTNVNP